MKWPWVSRARLEDAERRLENCNNERLSLLKMVLELKGSPAPVQPPVEEDRVPGFSTPFDRINSRFDREFAGKTIPQKFKARVR